MNMRDNNIVAKLGKTMFVLLTDGFYDNSAPNSMIGPSSGASNRVLVWYFCPFAKGILYFPQVAVAFRCVAPPPV